MPTPWWRQTYDLARQVLALTQKSEQHDADIKELRREVKELTAALQQFAFQMQQDRANAAKDRELDMKDRELLVLRLENQLLRQGRRLPPPTDDAEEDVP